MRILLISPFAVVPKDWVPYLDALDGKVTSWLSKKDDK